jgi:hypothetical protein
MPAVVTAFVVALVAVAVASTASIAASTAAWVLCAIQLTQILEWEESETESEDGGEESYLYMEAPEYLYMPLLYLRMAPRSCLPGA